MGGLRHEKSWETSEQTAVDMGRAGRHLKCRQIVLVVMNTEEWVVVKAKEWVAMETRNCVVIKNCNV